MNDTLLMILNPRKLPECLLSLERLAVPKVWLRNYREVSLEEVIPWVINGTDYEYYAVISDDCVVSEDAYRLTHSLRSPEHVATAYCNLDTLSNQGSLTKTPFPPLDTVPEERHYTWYDLNELRESPTEVIRSFFAGMCFTTMHRDMWNRFPWQVYGRHSGGWAADTHLAQRLHAADVPIIAHKYAMVYHTKPNWKQADNTGRRSLYVALEPGRVDFDTDD